MNNKDKVIVIDIDGTICKEKSKTQSYSDLEPRFEVINKILEFRNMDYYIILFTSRNMNTYNNNLGLINANTADTLFEWLKKYEIPYDEIYFGKPWADVYIDDNAVRFTTWNEIKDTGEELPIHNEESLKK